MGSVQTDAQGGTQDEIVVVVTGFGPFRAQHPINPAWEITKALPPTLRAAPHRPNAPTIRILIHPTPVRVSYNTVYSLVPKLWAQYPKIDFMVHIGMAAGRDYYSVERRGHRDGYDLRDVDGRLLSDYGLEDAWKEEKCPVDIETDVDMDDVWWKWKTAMPGVDVRPSEDAGRYLCDFIYYCSLSHLWKKKEPRRVVFFHVPVDSDGVAVEKGKDVAVELIRALVESHVSKQAELK